MNDTHQPVDDRVIPVTLVHWPDTIELCGYCTADRMTPELIEQLVLEVEFVLKEPVRLAIRDTSPEPLKTTIRKEAARAWSSPKPIVVVCNAFSRRNHVRITAGRFIGPFAGGQGADWARFSMRIHAGAPAAPVLIQKLREFAWFSGAFFIRADSPEWSASWARATDMPALQDTRLRIPSGAGWSITERFGWLNWFGPRATRVLGFGATAEEGGVAMIEHNDDGSSVVQLTRTPFDFRDAEYRRQFRALLERLGPHRHIGKPAQANPEIIDRM
ncbi:MAG TPA: hypothetical protein VGH80_05660 [Xanthomonadaceae bacterium]|jgi:hypothetical protein